MVNQSPRAEKWRADFPIFQQKTSDGQTLSYLDSAATSQKPEVVIDTLHRFYQQQNANINRGIYTLSERATTLYEESRHVSAKFIGSAHPEMLVFTHGASEAINLIVESYFASQLGAGDEIILTVMEHHANLVPWQRLAKQKALTIHYIPVQEDGTLDLVAYAGLLNCKTRVVACTHVSNVLGTINPVEKIVKMAHDVGAKVVLDGAQAMPQIPVDVTQIDCDFYVASAHKTYAPSGVGLVYAKPELLELMQPYQTGGNMIETVTLEGATFMPPPMRFEAGTPAIAETIAWASACTYLQEQGFEALVAYKAKLKTYLMKQLASMPNVQVYGTAKEKTPIAAFTHKDIHTHDLATILSSQGVAVRAGHHCAMPLHQEMNIGASTRASLSFYNNYADIDALITGIVRAEEIFYG